MIGEAGRRRQLYVALRAEGEAVQHLARHEADGGDAGGVIAADNVVFIGVAGPPADNAGGRGNASPGGRSGRMSGAGDEQNHECDGDRKSGVTVHGEAGAPCRAL